MMAVMTAMMISVLAIIPITNPRMLNLLAICEAAMASGILPAAYSESTYRVGDIVLLHLAREECDTNFQ